MSDFERLRELAEDELIRLQPEVCAVVEADAKVPEAQEEALAIIRRHGFVFETPLDKPDEERTEAERWEKLAFTLYTTLCELDAHSRPALAALREKLNQEAP